MAGKNVLTVVKFVLFGLELALFVDLGAAGILHFWLLKKIHAFAGLDQV